MKTSYFLIGKLVVSTEYVFQKIQDVIGFWILMNGQQNIKLTEVLISKFGGKRSLLDLLNIGEAIYGCNIFKVDKIDDLKIFETLEGLTFYQGSAKKKKKDIERTLEKKLELSILELILTLCPL